ncbi:putative sulfate exporter family transporter [Nocardia terrae]|uniref:putative sulfate exporter family transporter n=1 Tax=Nocardia terrae TaxID=2675851 RepID=UPI0038B31609
MFSQCTVASADTAMGAVSRWAFLLTFAGVGLNTNIRELARMGWRPLVVAVVGLVTVAVVSLGLVLFTSRVLHWGVGN